MVVSNEPPLEPLGARTEKIESWFEERGWKVVDGGNCWVCFEYLGSFGGDFPDDFRAFGEGSVKLSTLDCEVGMFASQLIVRVTVCGVENGCSQHKSYVKHLDEDFDHPEFEAALERWELHSRKIDRAELAECLTFGACGGSDRYVKEDEEAVWIANLESVPWTPYEDDHLPGGKNAAQLKIIQPNLFYAKFPPGFSAPAHSHPFATTYYVVKGSIQFGQGQEWLGPGSFRGVTAGHVYGPETAHRSEGCEFVLWSEGPITVDWSDPPAESDDPAV